MGKNLLPHQKAILLAGFITLVAWTIPFLGQVLLPIQYLNTHLHELSHALVGIISGADIEQIKVFSNGSGVTPMRGGAIVLVGSAGYLGAAFGGAAIILGSAHEPGARLTLRIVAGCLVGSMLFWVRGDWVGVASGLFWIAALIGLSFLRGPWLLFAAQFIGIQQCLSSFRSLYVLLEISAMGEGRSDAALLASETHIPAMVWSVAWVLVSVLLATVALRRVWRVPTRPDGLR